MNDRSTRWILAVILLLVTVNLALTAALWLQRAQAPLAAAPSQPTPNALPAYLDEPARSELAARFQSLLNAGDASDLYAELDELAKVQISEPEFAEQLRQLAVIGRVESAAYSHHESGAVGSFPAYVLHYKVRLSGGPFSTGTLKITIIDRGTSYGIAGFNLFGGAAG
jgi:hypothetical protein